MAVMIAGDYKTKFQKLEMLRVELETEIQSWKTHWQEIVDNLCPTTPKLFTPDRYRGDRRNKNIVDETGVLALRTAVAGMMAGIFSPARPSFRLTTSNPDLNENEAVKEYLYDVTRRMSDIFSKSNLYPSLNMHYEDALAFGTSALFLEEDMENVIHTTQIPLGSYMLACDEKGQINTFFRVFTMTIYQLVSKFAKRDKNGNPDWSNFSLSVKNMWEKGQRQTPIPVCHVIYPNDDYQEGMLGPKGKKYSSCYYEQGKGEAGYGPDGNDNYDRYLSESGYDYFPVMVTRWSICAGDVYATMCPGMAALGSLKSLYMIEKDILTASKKKLNPPLKAHSSLKKSSVVMSPGGITWVDNQDADKSIMPLFNVDFNTRDASEKQVEIRTRINQDFFADLFLSLSIREQQGGQPVTATEINAMEKERLMALGPVLERENQDLLEPLIDQTYIFMNKRGLLPEPPPELQGMNLKIEFISVLAQAQKLMGLSSIQNFLAIVQPFVELNPESLLKVDFEQLIDEAADILGVPPRVIRSDEKVLAMKAQLAQQQQAAQAPERAKALESATQAGKNLSETDTEGDNALTDILSQLKQRQAVAA